MPFTMARAVASGLADDKSRWDEEMQIFRQRTLSPNQLEALAKMKRETDDGKVSFIGDNLAIIEGMNNDAPVGCKVMFESGAIGVLLWRRDDNMCYVLLLADADGVAAGSRARCVISGVLQVIDEEEGPQTKPEYEEYQVPVGEWSRGQVLNHLGQPVNGSGAPGGSATLPLLNEQVSMANREVINAPLMVGVKAVDILTPLAKGSALLMVGPLEVKKSSLALDAVCNQAATGVDVIYAAVGCSQADLDERMGEMRARGALAYTTIVAATSDQPLGEQYAALCTALAAGERVRNAGGSSLVVLDSLESMVLLWDRMNTEEARLTKSAASLDSDDEVSEEALVEWEGMLVSAAAAQRRQFFSSLVQRAAKMHRRLGGGTMSLLMLLHGSPATGDTTAATRPPSATLAYKHLTDAQREKLEAALLAKAQTVTSFAGDQQHTRTEAIEELMSISDGQIVLQRDPAAHAGGARLDTRASLSRMGLRAYHPALQDLAPQVRLEIAQADDAQRFVGEAAGGQQAKRQRRAALLEAAILQPAGQATQLAEQVALLWVLQKGYLDTVDPADVQDVWGELWLRIEASAAEAISNIESSKQFTAASKRNLQDVCDKFISKSEAV